MHMLNRDVRLYVLMCISQSRIFVSFQCTDHPVMYVIKTEIDSKLSGLSNIVNFLSSTKDPVIVLGDLNLPDIDWDLFSLNNSNHTNCFIECMQSLRMTQFVSDSTRISNTHASNILDSIFVNDPLLTQITNQLPQSAQVITISLNLLF